MDKNGTNNNGKQSIIPEIPDAYKKYFPGNGVAVLRDTRPVIDLSE